MECTTVYRQSTTFLGEFVIFLQASRWVRMLALPRLGVLGLLPHEQRVESRPWKFAH